MQTTYVTYHSRKCGPRDSLRVTGLPQRPSRGSRGRTFRRTPSAGTPLLRPLSPREPCRPAVPWFFRERIDVTLTFNETFAEYVEFFGLKPNETLISEV